MAQQTRTVEGVGSVTFQKRRGSRSIRIHLHGNDVKVTMPYFVPYSQAERFVKDRSVWIKDHIKEPELLVAGAYIGKNHVIALNEGKALRTRVTKRELILTLPASNNVEDIEVQRRLKKAVERVLKQESQDLISARLNDLAFENHLNYKKVHFKKLKTRWGSCDHDNNLAFNIYLVQLPWDLIDYVIIHELSHTVHHDHSSSFWQTVEGCLPDYKAKRKKLKDYQSLILVS